MSKTKRKKQKKYYGFNKTQQLVIKIERVSKRADREEDRKLANDIKLSYTRNGYLAKTLKIEAERLVKDNPDHVKPAIIKKRHYLYAISNGTYIKIGMAIDVKRRMRELQTASPTELSIEWYKYCAEDSKEARRQEGKLHRALKKYHFRGEWHHEDCLDIVYDWVIRNRETTQEEEAIEINKSLDEQFSSIMGSI